MTDRSDIFLSYSRNDWEAAINLHNQLQRCGLSVFKDDDRSRAGELWLNQLQEAVGSCGAFVVLVGRDGVRRWIGAETQVALNRYFAPCDDALRLPIFPILLEGTEAETLPAFLKLFQMTPWNGADALPERLLDDISHRTIVTNKEAVFEGCPFVGLAAFRIDQAQLFFGRQKETLDVIACFSQPANPTVRWLEINGNSGSGKSSLMQAGLLPLVEKGWMWRPGGPTYERWTLIGPMMPGEHPVEMLAEHLARKLSAKMGEVVRDFQEGDDNALRYWLRERKKDETAFLLAIDQFEELFTFADPDERRRLDRLLARALEDADCPLFVISTVRSDFLDRFEDLPRLVAVRNRTGRLWTLPPIDADGLREVICGPARLAGLDISQVQEAMVAEARDEPGALPLIENALHWLWQQRAGNRLSGQLLTDQGGLAGILSQSADRLRAGLDKPQKDRALELLFRLVQVDPDARRHTRRRIPLAEAVDIAGGGKSGGALVNQLAGTRARNGRRAEGPLRLITVTEKGHVDLIHETLIRSKGTDAEGKPQPFWPTLWSHIERHMERAAWHERLRVDTLMWIEHQRRPSDLWSHERVQEAITALTQVGPEVVLSDDEREFLGPINTDVMLGELKKPETTHKRRLLIGERLDVLGVHPSRWGVSVDANGMPTVDWLPVPGGNVTVSILFDQNDPYSKVKDTRPKTVGIFHIARYPITVAQYRAFIDATDGWHDPAWWDDLYHDPEGNTYEFGSYGNQPAVYVSWFDAMAFCRWLGRRLDDSTVRLRTNGNGSKQRQAVITRTSFHGASPTESSTRPIPSKAGLAA